MLKFSRIKPGVALAATLGLAMASPVVQGLAPVAGADDGPAATYAAPAPAGYWLVGTDGGVFSYGGARFHGSTGAMKLNQPIVGMAPTPSAQGYWMVASDGGIFAFGDATFSGSMGAQKLNKSIVGMASTPSGNCYWMVASDGGIFAFGDARFFGSTGSIKLNKPIVGMAPTPSGNGYWMVASDGGIFAFGDATFFGSTGSIKLNQPINAMASTPSGRGYWLAGVDGGVFAFGDAVFHGAAPERPATPGVTRTVVALVPSRSGAGYWEVTTSGEILAFGDAPDLGGPSALARELVGMAGVPATATVPVATPPPGDPGTPAPAPDNPTPPTTAPYAGAPQYFSSVPNPTWGTGPSTVEDNKAGRVYALAEAGDKIFVGGEFESIVPPGKKPGPGIARKYLAALDRHTGQPIDWDPAPGDVVLALVASTDGKTLYVSGRFQSIGGGPAGRIAAFDVASGQRITTFNPPPANAGVRAMALYGDTLYVGGVFDKIGDISRDQLAALDATTGALRTDWVGPHNGNDCYTGQTGSLTSGCNGVVYDMAVTDDGSLLYVGGDFADFSGNPGVITIDARTGKESSWQADNDERPVFGLTVWPGDGKSLIVATGGTGGQVQFFEYKTSKRSSSPKWVHKVDGDATDVTATRERVYLVGHYDFVLGKNTVCGAPPCKGSTDAGDEPNRHLSVFDARTGAHDLHFTGQANTPQGPYVTLIGRDHWYVGGDFTNIDVRAGGQEYEQPGFVQFPAIDPRG